LFILKTLTYFDAIFAEFYRIAALKNQLLNYSIIIFLSADVKLKSQMKEKLFLLLAIRWRFCKQNTSEPNTTKFGKHPEKYRPEYGFYRHT